MMYFFLEAFDGGKGDDKRYAKVNHGDEVLCVILLSC